jgi:beta-lactamase class A
MKLISFSLWLVVLASGCSQHRSQRSEVPSPRPDVSSAALQNQIKEIAAAAKGKVGVAAIVLEDRASDDGRSPTNAASPLPDGRGSASGSALVSLNPHEHFPMQSVYKLPISMAVMKQVDAGKIKLTDKIQVMKSEMVGRRAYSPIRDRHRNGAPVTVEDLLRYAIADSDGTASDVLMRIAGGPAAIQAYLTELGIKDMIVLDTEQTFAQDQTNTAQYRNYSTPEAAVALLRALHERRGLSEASQALLLKFMTESKSGQKRLKGLLPKGTVVAHKTGTSNTDNGMTAATNDIGIITLSADRHVAIAVFVSDSLADEATREGVIAKIAKAVYENAGGSKQ